MGWPSTWLSEYISISPEVRDAWNDLTTPQLVYVGLACSTSFVVGWKLAKSGSSWKRITSIADISSSNMGPGSSFLRGRVVSVSDGDTFRLLHVPTRFHSSKLGDQKLSDVALPIRICTIDTPETAKFGKHGQPFGDDAKDYLKSMILDRIVKVRLLEKDQYGRGVAEVYRPGPFLGWPRKYMDQEMLKVSSVLDECLRAWNVHPISPFSRLRYLTKAGLAEVYLGAGAVYGNKNKDAYLGMQSKAERRKMGMWSQNNRESAAEFKARMKSQT